MKLILQLTLVLFCLNSFGQKTGEITIPLAQVVAAKSIHDLISDLPKDCKVNSFSLMAKIDGVVKNIPGSGRDFSKSFKTFLGKSESGTKIFIDDLESSCPKSHKKNYKITVE